MKGISLQSNSQMQFRCDLMSLIFVSVVLGLSWTKN